MCVRRLPVLLLSILLCVATVAAQSSSDKSTDSSSPAPAQSSSPARTIESRKDSLVLRPLGSHTQHILTFGQDETTCLTLRTYRVARIDPESDTTRVAGYSTCQPSVRFQLKTAVDSHEIVVR